MNPNQIVEDAKTKLRAAVVHFQDELKKLRTGRAHASMLDSVTVSAYGSMMPLNQLANVTAPEAQLLQVTPFDPSNIQAIAGAIRDNQSLGLNPSDDGRVVRVSIPALTTERRQLIVKQIGEKTEECNITLRQIRHEAFDKVKAAEKSKTVTQDERSRVEKQIDEVMAKTKQDIDAAAKAKEQELMTI